jgi:dihydroorotate dehydrogenase (fumarate)
VEGEDNVVKYLLAGADVVMTASALLRHGPEHVEVLLGGLVDWMTRKGFGTVRDMRGPLAVPESEDETAYERHGYVRVLQAAARTYRPW